MRWTEIEVKTELAKQTLPTQLRSLPFQIANLFLILSISSEKLDLDTLP